MNPNIHTAPTQVQNPDTAQRVFELPPQYEFMSAEKMDRLREQQLDAELDARKAARTSGHVHTATKEALKNLEEGVGIDAERYVATYMNRDEDPELFDKLKTLVENASYFATSNIAW